MENSFPVFLKKIRPRELQTAVDENWPLLVPAGCVEWHGPHLPLGLDTLIAEAVCRRVAKRVSAVIAPPLEYGATGYAVSGPELGTMDVDNESFAAFAKSVLRAFCQLGFRRIACVVHHQGMNGMLALALRKASTELMAEMALQERGTGWYARKPSPNDPLFRFNRLRVLPTWLPSARSEDIDFGGGHGGRFETSLALAIRPELVDPERLDGKELSWLFTEHPSREATAALGERALRIAVDAWEAELRAWE